MTEREREEEEMEEMEEAGLENCNMQRDGSAPSPSQPSIITNPITFCAGMMLRRNLVRNNQALRALTFIAIGKHPSRDVYIPDNSMKIVERYYTVRGEDEDGLRIYNPKEERVSSRAIPVAEWEGKNIEACLVAILGEYEFGDVVKLGELTIGNITSQNYKAMQKALFNYILEDWRVEN